MTPWQRHSLRRGSRRPGHKHARHQIRRRCEEIFASLDLPAGFDIPVLCERLGQQRGVPIRLLAVPLDAEQFYGAWVTSSVADFVLYETNTSKPHQEHIVAHELAHMLCGHRTSGELDTAIAELLFPDIDRDLVRDMLTRGGYSDQQEQEAELMASVILERITRRPLETTWTVPADAAETIARIEHSLVPGGPGGPARQV